MNELYEKSLHKLELDKVLCLLADQACSASGKEQCLKTQPLSDADEIRLLQKQTSAACRMITLKGSPGLAGVSDVGASVDRAVRGGCLSPEELLRVAGVLKCARQAKAYADGEGRWKMTSTCFFAADHARTNTSKSASLPPSSPKTSSRTRPASELASIRRKIRQQSAKIRESLQKIITSPSYAKISAGADRDHPLRPLRRAGQGRVQGRSFRASSTMCLPPAARISLSRCPAVNGNNELRELFMAERKEIERILARAVRRGRPATVSRSELDYDVLLELDCIFARARLSFAMRAICPEVRTDGQLEPHPGPPSAHHRQDGRADLACGWARDFDYADHHRPQHRRQDRHAQDHRAC